MVFNDNLFFSSETSDSWKINFSHVFIFNNCRFVVLRIFKIFLKEKFKCALMFWRKEQGEEWSLFSSPRQPLNYSTSLSTLYMSQIIYFII